MLTGVCVCARVCVCACVCVCTYVRFTNTPLPCSHAIPPPAQVGVPTLPLLTSARWRKRSRGTSACGIDRNFDFGYLARRTSQPSVARDNHDEISIHNCHDYK